MSIRTMQDTIIITQKEEEDRHLQRNTAAMSMSDGSAIAIAIEETITLMRDQSSSSSDKRIMIVQDHAGADRIHDRGQVQNHVMEEAGTVAAATTAAGDTAVPLPN